MKTLMRGAALALLICIGCAPRLTSAQSLCGGCELQVGIGDTYHFWGTTGGVVLPVTLKWSDGRYEFGVFRMSTRQVLYDAHYTYGRVMANPYWGLSLSRRWRIFDRGPVRGFFGFGIAAKTEADQCSVTHWDFAEQLGVRFPLPGNRLVGELTFRHWSNGGVRLPNHGQDFLTLTISVNSGLFGPERSERIAIYRRVDFKSAEAVNNLRAANVP